MSERGKEILATFERVIPELSELEQEKLLSFGEGLAFAKNGNDDSYNGSEKIIAPELKIK